MLLSAPMDSLTKSIINESGYEEWSKQEIEQDYKISKDKVNRAIEAIMVSKQDRLARDVAAYDELLQRAKLVRKPPFRSFV